MLVDLGLHRRLLKVRYSRALHAMIFAEFLVVFSAIIQNFGSGLIPGFSLQPIGGNTWIALLQDTFAIIIMIGIGLVAWQRTFLRPKRFEGSNAADAWTRACSKLAKANIDLLEQCTFSRIMTTDPHTLNAPRQEYGTFDCRYEVIHYTQLLNDLIRENRLVLKKAAGGRVTYHDPCYLGRYNGGFEAPRALILASGHCGPRHRRTDPPGTT